MKKLLTVLLTVLLVLSFAGCSKGGSESKDELSIKVACTLEPHSVILDKAKEILATKGVTLEVVVYNDYVLPMNVVQSGELDANYFAHVPYINNFNESNGTEITPVAGIHYEPMGIYAGAVSSLSELKDGDIIAVPNDPTNETRALLLLQDNGIITLPEGANLDSSLSAKDVVSVNANVEIKELEAAQLPRILDEVAVAVINGNYALEAGCIDKVIVTETSESLAATTYVNVLAVKKGSEDNAAVKALIEVLQGDEIAAFIAEKYGAAVVPFAK